jgi:hypothetical protein
MPETSIAPPPVSSARPGKPVSEALLNEKVCSCLRFLLSTFKWSLRSLAWCWDWFAANGYAIVGSLSFVPPNPLLARSLLWCCVLGSIVQAEGMACVGWSWVWGRKSI